MNRTAIEYLQFTWNPIVGCSGVDCAVREACWAKGQAKRRKHKCKDCYDFKPHYHFERLDQPSEVKKSARIGVGFMGDIFDAAFSINMNQLLFSKMEKAFWHTFVCLTKQSKNLLTFNQNWQSFPENIWMGVSVNRREDVHRIEDLKATDAKVKFVSFEPLYEEVTDLHHSWLDLKGIDWIIIGAQKRPNLQPEQDWVSNLLSFAVTAGVKVFLKNNLACIDQFGRLQEVP